MQSKVEPETLTTKIQHMKQNFKYFEKISLPGNIRRIKMLPEAVGVTALDKLTKNFSRQAFFTRKWKPSKRAKQTGGSKLVGKQSGGWVETSSA